MSRLPRALCAIPALLALAGCAGGTGNETAEADGSAAVAATANAAVDTVDAALRAAETQMEADLTVDQPGETARPAGPAAVNSSDKGAAPGDAPEAGGAQPVAPAPDAGGNDSDPG